ncbi:hypothetical protein [Azospirillum argentinense]|uniref:hypothetical protein n=1 Tax=Azospirillum argentinense TaxID=2970906 RepID=UPI0032E0111F
MADLDLDERAQKLLLKIYRGGGLSFHERVSASARLLKKGGYVTVATEGSLLTTRGVTTARSLAEAAHG